MLIAQFLLVYKDALAKAEPSHNLQDLKDLAREKESLTVLISGLKNDIKRMRQITFPEFEKRCHVFSESMRDFLKQFPSARLIRAMDPRVLQRALNYADGLKAAPFYAEDLVAEAQKSVASDSVAKELIIPEKIATLEQLMEKREKIAKTLVVACEALMIEDIEIITSIGGIGNTMASAFLAEVGDYRLFPSYKRLVAFAGLGSVNPSAGEVRGIKQDFQEGQPPPASSYFSHDFVCGTARQYIQGLLSEKTSRRLAV